MRYSCIYTSVFDCKCIWGSKNIVEIEHNEQDLKTAVTVDVLWYKTIVLWVDF